MINVESFAGQSKMQFVKKKNSFKAFCINLQNICITKFLPYVNGMIMGNSKAGVCP